jgi:hypothetical protein
MKVIFYHGLESPALGEKQYLIDNTYNGISPAMDYRKKGIFARELARVKKEKPDLIVGSSMGGWFAYGLSTFTGIPTLLFNPALHDRSFEPDVKIGNKRSEHTVVLGKNDDDVDPIISKQWIMTAPGKWTVFGENIGHRTPQAIFQKHLMRIFAPKNEALTYETFNEYVNEKGFND